MMGVLRVAVLACFFVGWVSAEAQGVAGAVDVERKQLNDWMAERAETMIRAHKLGGEILGAWADPRYSSTEIDALRARYRELQQELSRTQLELQKKVQEIPAVKEKARQLDEAKRKEQELAKRITEKTGVKQ